MAEPELLRIGVGGVVPVAWNVEKSGPGTLTGWAAVHNVIDQQGDILAYGALRKTIGTWRATKRVIPLTLDHQNTAEGVIGSLADAEETSYGLKTTFQFSSDQKAQDARTKAREGHLNGLSIFGPIINKTLDIIDGQEVRVLKEVGLISIGLTPIPANTGALVLAAKTTDLAIKPLQTCEADGNPGWKWGDAGTCYTYTPGDEASQTAARKKALAQATAMGEFPGTGNKALILPDEWLGDFRTAAAIHDPYTSKVAIDTLIRTHYDIADASPETPEPAAAETSVDQPGDQSTYALDIAGMTGPGVDPSDGATTDRADLFASLDETANLALDLDDLEKEIGKDGSQ